MRLRALLTAARATGWAHVIYSGSFGREHVWRRGTTYIGLSGYVGSCRDSYRRLTLIENGVKLVPGALVDSVDQVVHLLAAYGLINCPHREKLARIQDGYAQINRTVDSVNEGVFARWQELRANNGVPIGGAS